MMIVLTYFHELNFIFEVELLFLCALRMTIFISKLLVFCGKPAKNVPTAFWLKYWPTKLNYLTLFKVYKCW